MSKKHKKVLIILNHFEHLLILVSEITEYASISAFTSLVGIPIGIKNSAIGLKTCAITARIKKCKFIVKKKKKNHNKLVLLAKTKLNSIEVLISKALVYSYISYDKFVLVNNASKKYDDVKERKNQKCKR